MKIVERVGVFFRFNVVAIAMVGIICFEASARDSIDPGDSDSLWVLGVEGTFFDSPYVSSEGNDLGYISPEFRFNGDRFFVKDGSLNLRVATFDSVSSGLMLSVDEGYLSDKDNYKDNKKLADIKERDSALLGGFYVIHDSVVGRLSFSLLTDLEGVHNGQVATLKYMFDMHAGNWNVNPYIGFSWISGDAVDYHVGVRSEEATLNRSLYQGKSAEITFAGVRGRYEITESWDIEIGAGISHLGSGISNSSIIIDDLVYHASFGFHYNF